MIEPRNGSAPNAATILALTALALGCATAPAAPPEPVSAEVTASAAPQAPAGSADLKDAIRRVVRSHASETKRCYEQRLAVTPGLAGKVTLSWAIRADGTAGDATILADSTTLLDEEVHECLRAAVERWTFPERSGKVTKVTYPFVFRE